MKASQKPEGRSTIPSATSRERASVAAAATPKAKATTPPKEADGGSATTNGPSNGQVDRAALEDLLEALIAANNGDFCVRLSIRRNGIIGEIASNYNELVDMNGRMVKEFGRIRRVIGREGRMQQRA